MEITWLGTACFRLRGKEATIVNDPPTPQKGAAAAKLTADVVTVSHQHADHNYTDAISGEYRMLDGPGEYEVAGVFIQGVPSFHDDRQGKDRGKDVIFRFDVDDISVCHLGDLGHTLSSGQAEAIGTVDVLLIPVGGRTTINGAQAAEVASLLEPRIVIPMHYNTGAPGTEDFETVDRFCKEMGAAAVKPQPRVNVTRSNLPANTQVVLLEQSTRGGAR